MAYQPHDWSNNRPPGISAQVLREMDEGIKAAHDEIESRSGTSVTLGAPVGSAAYLPTEGNEVGDGRITQDDQHLWQWDGTQWVDLGAVKGDPGQVEDATVAPLITGDTTTRAAVEGVVAVGQPLNAIRDAGMTKGGTTESPSLNALLTGSLSQGRPAYLPQGTYALTDTNHIVTVPAGSRWGLVAEPGATLKVADDAVTADWHTPLLVTTSGTGKVDRVDISGLRIDGNLRGQTAPPGEYDWEHAAALRIGGTANAPIDHVSLRDLDFHDPLADGIWFNTYYIDTVSIRGVRATGRTASRSDITFSGLPKHAHISDVFVTHIDLEPVNIPAEVKHQFRVKLDNVHASGSLALDAGADTGADSRLDVHVTSATAGHWSINKVSGHISGCRLDYFDDPVFPRRINSPRNLVVENCDVYLPADASGVITPLSVTHQAGTDSHVTFRGCRFHVKPVDGYAGPFIGSALKFSVATTTGMQHLVEGCWFDARFPTSVHGDRCGDLTLRDNDYAGTTDALLLTQSTTYPTTFRLDGGSWARVTGNFARFASAAAGMLDMRNIVVPSARAAWAASGAPDTMPMRNNRIQMVTAPPTGPGIRGDRARLETPVAGAVVEWVCTASSASSATWKATQTLAA